MARRGRPPTAPTSGGSRETLSEDAELALALAVARAYYLENESKVAIAERLGITRFQAARLLDVARETGMVHIEVRPPGRIDHELSTRLQEALGVERAVVVVPLPGVSPLETVAQTLAQLVSDVVVPGDVVGFTWSRATIAMTDKLFHLEPCTVVQLGGHVEAAGLPGTAEIVRRAAQISGGTAHSIYAPLVVEDAHTAESLRQQPEIARSLELFDRLTVAVVSIGAWIPSGSTIYETSSDAVRTRAAAAGVVGEMGARLFDADGRAVTEVIDDQVIGISLDQLHRIPQVIVTGYGAYRAAATIAAARAGLVTTLIADQSLARAVLDRA